MKKLFNDYRREEGDGSAAFGDLVFGKAKNGVATPNEGGAGAATGSNPTGGANPTPPTPPTPEQIEADTKVFETLSQKDEKELTEAEKKTLADIKLKYDIKKVDADGKEITAEAEKAEAEKQARIKTIQAKAENQRTLEEIKFLNDNVEKEKSLYEQVDELTGSPVTVDYGDTNPSSPEGVVLRETAIRESAIEQFEKQLQEELPLAYQFLLHQQAGGSPESFFSVNNEDWNKVALTKDDKAGQETLFRRALAMKGTAQEQIDLFVQTAKDKGKLFDWSTGELAELQKRQTAEAAQRKAQAAQVEAKEKELVSGLYSTISQHLEKGIAGVNIPKAEWKQFSDSVTSNIFVRDGQLIYYKPLDLKSLESELAAEYFRFKKANLAAIVANKAKSVVTDQKRAIIKASLVPRTASSNASSSGKKVPMNEV